MAINTSKVNFFFDGILFTLPNRRKLKEFIEFIFERENATLESVNYIFCSDRKLLKINQEYLKHNYLTDIITFDLSERKSIIAEIYISTERVRENAIDHQVSFKEELHRVIFHGALHLCGYKDKTRPASREMRAGENYYLRKYLGSVSRDTF